MRIPFFGQQIDGPEAEVVKSCEELLLIARNARAQEEVRWMENALYLHGNQWEHLYKDFLTVTRRADIRAPEAGKEKLVSNRLLTLARQSRASIQEHSAMQIATAATSDPDDVAAAELATDVLQGRYHEDDEPQKQANEIGWCQVAGSCMRYTYWDPKADGTDWNGDKQEAIGDVVTETWNPFQYYVAPWYDSQGQMPWVIHSSVRDIDEINDLFPGHDVGKEEVAAATGNLDRLLLSVVENQDQQPPKRDNAALLNVLYQQPDHRKGAPRGRLTAWANKKLLWRGKLPEGELTMTRLQWFPIVGRVYPLPFLSPLIDLQRQINIILSQLIELKNRQLRGDIIIRGTGKPTQEYILDENGTRRDQKYIRIPAGILDWKFLEYNLEVAEAERLLERLWNDMREIAGVHEPTSGAQLNRQTTATEVMRLVESDLKGMTIFRAAFDLNYADVSRHKLVVIKNHYEMPRMVRVVGASGAVNARAFYGSDLRNTEDVRPKASPLVTETMKLQLKQEALAPGFYELGPQARLTQCMRILNSGLPEAREVVDDMLAPGTLEELKAFVAAVERANMARIIQQISGQGNEPAPNPPSTSIRMADLPPEGQIQLAAQAGIDLTGGQGQAGAEGGQPALAEPQGAGG